MAQNYIVHVKWMPQKPNETAVNNFLLKTSNYHHFWFIDLLHKTTYSLIYYTKLFKIICMQAESYTVTKKRFKFIICFNSEHVNTTENTGNHRLQNNRLKEL